MPYTIHPISLSDALPLARNNCTAFWHQPYWRIMWPNDMQLPFMLAQVEKRITASVILNDRDAMRHEKAVDDETGEIIGYCRWMLPESLVKRGKETGEVVWRERQVEEVSEEVRKKAEEEMESAWFEPREDMGELDGRIDEALARVSGDREYIKLEYLAVYPERQGQGVGTALVESGIRKAEELGMPIFVMGFDVSRNLYLRLGFREVESVLQDDRKFGGDGNYNAYFMVYDRHLV
ncbi:acyl-CoA N-acyltransferase [Podospora aff. communis PSN243]|uniref:Acyl-CoA N-acyltransferase n=1 Tax=Podospora aff. communis PSN243 TaxID=3040156 RepID=A0AAV9GRB1_9PEZI|nr:acyl-CoA N-acyltransferase [Podospora aff. communis PSN243]